MKTLRVLAGDQRIRQLLLYAICGGTGILTDLAIYTALVQNDINYQAANAAGYAAGTLASFFLNRHFTFKVYDRALQRLVLFFGAAFVGYLISSALLWALVSAAHIHPLPSKLATLVVILVLQFSLNRAITFRTSSDKDNS